MWLYILHGPRLCVLFDVIRRLFQLCRTRLTLKGFALAVLDARPPVETAAPVAPVRALDAGLDPALAAALASLVANGTMQQSAAAVVAVSATVAAETLAAATAAAATAAAAATVATAVPVQWQQSIHRSLSSRATVVVETAAQ